MRDGRLSTAVPLLGLIVVGVAIVALVYRGSSQVERGRDGDAMVYGARVVTQTGTVPDVLREGSGVAVSRTHPGVLWSHNDSGFPPTLYAIGIDGAVIGAVHVDGAENIDWEDLALGPCPPVTSAPPTDCLYVGDIGDNVARRDHVVVYAVPEPDPSADVVPLLASLRISYPEGPDDAESLAVDADGHLTIVTKGRLGAMRLLRVPASAWTETGSAGTVAVAQGVLAMTPDFRQGRQATGAAVSPSGRWLAVRTYRDVYFLARSDGGWTLDGSRCYLWGREPQGEAVDFLDEQTLVVTSESVRGRPGTILRVQCDRDEEV